MNNPLNLVANIFKKDSAPIQNYLALTITSDKVLACIWTFTGDNVQVLGFAQRPYKDIDSLEHHLAVAIDSASQSVNGDFSKAVFGLSQNWLEDENVTDETSKMLKKLSSDLEFEPEAFVSLPAAINHLLKIEESVTPYAILIGIFSNFCEVSLLKNNKIISSKTLKSQIDLDAEKIFRLVSHLKEAEKELPSRIILYGLDEKAHDKQTQGLTDQLVKLDWKDVFIHEPKIDVVENQELARAAAYSHAADILGYEPVSSISLLSSEPTASSSKISNQSPVKDQFGFVEGEDILQKEDSLREADQSPPEKFSDNLAVATGSPTEDTDLDDVVTLGWFAKIISIFKKRPSAKKLAIFLVFILLLILAGSYLATQTLTKAEIVIKVNSQIQEEKFKSQVVLKSPKVDDSEIIGQKITFAVKDSQKAVATGEKIIGEFAKGQATIFNWTKEATTFSKDTVIISKDGLKFSLDSQVEIASRSASSPGQNIVTVTAEEFGQESNLEEGKEFAFQEFDELLYSARNETAFSGGNQRQVTVVSEEDLARLEESTFDSLFEKAKNTLRQKVTDLKLHEDAITTKVLQKSFDKQVGEEASLVNLTMEVEASAIIYSEDNLKNLLAQVTKDIPENSQIREEDIVINQISAQRLEDSLSLSGEYKANLIPRFEEDDLKAQIAGKSLKETRATIFKLKDVKDVEITFSPNIPLTNSIPKNHQKINLKVEAI